MDRFDRHHLLFPRQEWELRPEGRKLRETGSLIQLMNRIDHDELHKQVPLVPLLGHTTLMAVGRKFHPEGVVLDDLDRLCVTIDKVSQPQHAIERGIAEVAISSLLLQRDFLKGEGYV